MIIDLITLTNATAEQIRHIVCTMQPPPVIILPILAFLPERVVGTPVHLATFLLSLVFELILLFHLAIYTSYLFVKAIKFFINVGDNDRMAHNHYQMPTVNHHIQHNFHMIFCPRPCKLIYVPSWYLYLRHMSELQFLELL